MKNMYYAVRHYLERVLSIGNVDLHDGPLMGVQLEPNSRSLRLVKGKYQMTLPLSEQSMAEMWGELYKKMPDDIIWTILIAGLFHELGHIISGEPQEVGNFNRLMSNLINDANEHNVIPAEWFGAMRYLQISNEVATALHGDLDRQDSDASAEFGLLVEMAAIYRPMLGIPFGGKVVSELPDDHPLHDDFEDIKIIMEDSRRSYSQDRHVFFRQRTDLIARLGAVFKKWHQKQEESNKSREGSEEGHEGSEGNNIPSLDSMTESVGRGGLIESMKNPGHTDEELEKIIKKAAPKLDRSEIREEFESAQAAAEYDKLREERQSYKKLKKLLKKKDKQVSIDSYVPESDGGGCGHGYDTVPPSGYSGAAEPDSSAVFKLQRYFKRLMFDRTYKGRYIDFKGRKLHAPNFYQIKTQPEDAKLMHNVTGVKTDVGLTHAVFMFDKSGSMGSRKKSVICKRIMATFHKAISVIPELRLSMFGFDTTVYPIVNGKRDIYAEIDRVLNPGGGTDLPFAYRVGLRTLEKSTARRKLLVLLTDGDVLGSYRVADLKRLATYQKVQVVCISIGYAVGEDSAFDSFVSISNVKQLADKFRKVTLKRF